MPITAALVGYGLAGRLLHAPVMEAAGIEIGAVVSSRTEEIRAERPSAAVCASLEEALALPGIDLVVLATPNHLHYEQARRALQAGRHVVVDKPFVLTHDEAAELKSLAEARGLVLSVYHNRRWDADFLTIRRLLGENRLGRVFNYAARWDRFRPSVQQRWREEALPGAGLLYDLGPHLADQAIQLFGMPDWVEADVFVQREGGAVDDGFEIRAGKGPLRLSLGAASVVADGGWRYRIDGTAGSFLKRGIDPQEAALRAGGRPTEPGFGEEAAENRGILVSGEGAREEIPSEAGRWTTFYEGIVRAIRDGGEPPVTAASAAETVRFLDAVRQAAERHARVVL
ncbi:Gfo/Idh/MocA family oxidoreductase [Antarcticirhabdus aurantiaca]|uniref:Gfo/Idh/MocA family oxidoreductase n=1 Tax=Antarcticirhabdus aurantiaca TaxID=2606717 RepID=A0ACD4NHF3_9HYPH|nr:Gfo/Idh/MocA family oxidoreductase [Antarcticirhabdus aurantiaca]WAJ26265.1 Gfo/Idh/MocA family oxidoreductase [Jeongeuplla avenae]